MTPRMLTRLTAGGLGALAVAAATVVAATPARADFTPAVAGYVWSPEPSAASYTVPMHTSGGVASYTYGANSGNGPITITRSAVGTYQVRFGGLGALVAGGGGVAHAQAYGTVSDFCTVTSWYPSGTDLYVNVACFTAGGARGDTRFTADFVEASPVSATEGVSYLWANQPTAASYTPSGWYRYDVTGGTPTVTRDSTGSYRVYLPASAGQKQLTFYQVTAYTSAAVSCKAAGYLGGGTVRVQCRGATGSMVDSRFTITWTIYNLLQRIAPTAMSTVSDAYPSGGAPVITWTNDSSVSDEHAVTRVTTGYYQLFFPQILDPSGHAVAHANGYQSARCHVAGWYPVGTADMRVNVFCVNSTGAAVDAPFTAAFTW